MALTFVFVRDFNSIIKLKLYTLAALSKVQILGYYIFAFINLSNLSKSKNCNLSVLLALFLITCLPSVSYSQIETSQFQNKQIAKIEIKFKSTLKDRDEKAELRDLINITSGEEYSTVKIREAILKLYKSGRASDVVVEALNTPEGVLLTFLVTRQMRVDEITFSGEPIFAETDLKIRTVGLEEGTRVSQPSIERSAENLVQFFHDSGYFQVAITPSIKTDETKERANIDFQITPGQRATISESINLVGNLKLDPIFLLTNLKTQPGSPFILSNLQEDIELLRKRHIQAQYLDPQVGNPEVSYNSENNTVSIRLAVNSGAKVDVAVEGMEISSRKLQDTLPMFRQGGSDDFTIEQGRRDLLEIVQQEGYFFANIDSKKEEISLDNIRITYFIDKGQRYRVSDIRLIGTDEFTIVDIAEQLKSRKAAFSARGITSQDLIASDSETIANLLKDLGYTNAKVTERRLGVSPNNQNLVITFVVEEGLRITVAETIFIGNKALLAEELKAKFPKRKLNYFSSSRLNEDIEAILEAYSKKGYPEAQVVTKVENIDEMTVRTTFTIEEGDQVVINRVVINNRGRSQEKYIRKYLTFSENGLLRRDDFSKSEQQLYATGAFRIAQIHSELVSRDSENRALHDVFVETTEAPSYTLTYGFGYQSEDGARGLLQISNVNLLGRLQTGTLTLRASRREQLGQVSYLFPKPFGLEVNPLLVFFYRRREDSSFTSRRLTALLQIEQQVNEKTDLFFRYAFEDVNVFDLKVNDVVLNRSDRPVRLGRISSTVVNDSRDNIFNATKGTFTSADLSISSVALGSDREFIKLFANHQRYGRLPTKAPVILANNLQIGLAKSFDKQVRLPLTERFFAGGANTLRGFGFEKAGPRNAIGRTIGGNALVILSSELRFPLTNRLGGVLFYDTGNVFRKTSDIGLRKFSNTLGTGLRITTPVGPLRFDVGFLLNPRVPERRVQFHFSFGQAF
ncbi:MAG: outer membrane protein assembly factor BamA [Acidobacteria bacterium]|nr:outer membrane protein assembly factor BamA [Acidobacteriota bacterium]